MNELARPLHDEHVQPAAEPLPGMRLDAVEVFNWGTFDGRIWPLYLGGQNALLTGDIGSGKSTLVDAITTLLVPSQKIAYNKAAGAELRERDLRSYVLGYFKAERGDPGLSAKAVGLRQAKKAFSVILARFRNNDYAQDVTLAQVFWFKENVGQPDRFLAVADCPLSIKEHFSGFGGDINALRKRLRKQNVELHDSFPSYGAAFRRRFGIANEQALDLFLQTVSMKQVGDLTDFVRNHMLEPFPVETNIAQMLAHFADLTAAHEAVLKARDQIERLTPIVEDCNRHLQLATELDELKVLRNVLHAYFANLKCQLLDERLSELDSELARLGQRIARLVSQMQEGERARDDIKQAIVENGGDRIATLEREIAAKRAVADERRGRALIYDGLAKELGLVPPRNIDQFVENANRAKGEIEQLQAGEADIQNQMVERRIPFDQLKKEHETTATEIKSLKSRRSSIPSSMLEIRERICQALNLNASKLPFAGELIEVRSDAQDWEGAAERLIRPFALSLLVPDTHYTAVASWVDSTHLASRLVYYRVAGNTAPVRPRRHRDALSERLRVHDRSDFYGWLLREIDERFDHVCCNDMESFRREPKAITKSGQIKGRGERHEKDDRFRIDDRTRYVLGWSNESKIAALEKEARSMQARMQTLASEIARLLEDRKSLGERLGRLQRLSVYQSYAELDWKAAVVDIERLDEERRHLAEGSDVLKTLNGQLAAAEASLQDLSDKLVSARDSEAKRRDRREQAVQQRATALSDLLQVTEDEREMVFPKLDAVRAEALGIHQLTVEGCDPRERELRDWLTTRIENEGKKIQRLRDRITQLMQAYASRYTEETREVDATPEAWADYTRMLEVLTSDGLPRFETRFKDLLNVNTIRDIAGFHARLRREEDEIRERIDIINRSLRQIDYNPGRYIELEDERTIDPEIREFQQDLRKCTEGSISGTEDSSYSEAKFLEVRRIMERLRGRDGFAEADKRWTRKVTDVRNWFVFSASERHRADDTEHEHYSDSGGKSGGQKEKLAYTVLAASLAYQFGIDRAAERSRAFHFVMIDEAFGRGSDDSADFALKLFKGMGLQLLIATPLQKIHVIEPYVASVGYVHNEDGKHSMLRNMTIEEYRAEQLRRTGGRL
ncbi:MAG: ATP-binding protein [Pseudorhodoplanes sp.]